MYIPAGQSVQCTVYRQQKEPVSDGSEDLPALEKSSASDADTESSSESEEEVNGWDNALSTFGLGIPAWLTRILTIMPITGSLYSVCPITI